MATGLACKLLPWIFVPVAAEVSPIRDIVLSTFHKGPPDLLLALSFVSQFLLAGSHGDVFQPHYPWLKNILSLLAALHASPNVTLHCALEVEILFNSLSLSSDIQKDIKEHAILYPSVKHVQDPIVNDVDVLAVTHQQPVELRCLEDHDSQFKSHNDAIAVFPEQFECHKKYNVEKLEDKLDGGILWLLIKSTYSYLLYFTLFPYQYFVYWYKLVDIHVKY